jgi:hypothetical protein
MTIAQRTAITSKQDDALPVDDVQHGMNTIPNLTPS